MICGFPASFDPGTSGQRLFVKSIFFNGVRVSMGSEKNFWRATCDSLGTSDQEPGSRSEAVRCRLINEVQGSSGFENVPETSGFHGADFLSGSETSVEPVVFSHARDFISASSCSETTGSQVEFGHQVMRFCCVILSNSWNSSQKMRKNGSSQRRLGIDSVKPGECDWQIIQVSNEFKSHTSPDQFQITFRADHTNCEWLSKNKDELFVRLLMVVTYGSLRCRFTESLFCRLQRISCPSLFSQYQPKESN